MQDYVLQLINQLLPGLLYIAALAAIYYAKKLFEVWYPKVASWYETHISEATRKAIRELGQEAFVYAETVYREKNGADKLKEALAYFNQQMSRYCLSNLNVDVIRAAIEAAWLEDKRKEFAPVELAEIRAFEGTK